jgi:hypothetical protein
LTAIHFIRNGLLLRLRLDLAILLYRCVIAICSSTLLFLTQRSCVARIEEAQTA